jgi:hypothetical protein
LSLWAERWQADQHERSGVAPDGESTCDRLYGLQLKPAVFDQNSSPQKLEAGTDFKIIDYDR